MILLDTHVLVWQVVQPQRLSHRAASAIRSAHSTDGLAIASITLWELATLFARQRLVATGTVEESVRAMVEAARVAVKSITPTIAALAAQFPSLYRRDPADRLIGATARAEGLILVTRDKAIRSSNLIATLW